ncbi:cobaltochelatase subunit CobN [Methanobrevibacter woesei]|uniref:cobaltochelatase subunit CobN n=1 Tax=Methanobrevibacter woesei TaxID=190976 RepID=UPI0023EF8F83|nr:cobaltochelatase subunit CobN [Methanobrevibacter woesei]
MNYSRKWIFLLSLLVILLMSCSMVSAEDINSTDADYSIDTTSEPDVVIRDYQYGAISDSEVITAELAYSENAVSQVNSNDNCRVEVNVKDSYNPYTDTWVEEGVNLQGATVKVYDSSNNMVFAGITDNNGHLTVSDLNTGSYTVKISYDTYEEKVELINFVRRGGTVTIDSMFVPDILLLVDYNSHSEKVDILTSLSKRVAYISTMDWDKTLEWLIPYAKFIQLDMYASGTYEFNPDILTESQAYDNYLMAYTFGVYDESLISSLDFHFVGASATNNSYNTIENTYIGSYFQAEDTPDETVLNTNMENLLAYIEYLINPNKYVNPTLDPKKTPLVASMTGIYHPDFGTLTLTPSQEEINNWILSNPGYNDDGIGSLNWMTNEYVEWQKVNLDPKILINQFEEWYGKNGKCDSSFIIIASYYAGGPLIDSLIETFEEHGKAAFNVYHMGTNPSMASILLNMVQESKFGVSAINSLYSWSLDYANGGAVKNLTDLDLTILKGVYDISQESYGNALGPQLEWTYAVTIPSFEGVFGAVVLSYVDTNGNTVVIQSGVEKLVEMTLGWADLKDMDNSDKKITIVLYNYPPGKAEIGASYLDVFQSTHDLLEKLYDEGYDIGMDKDEIPSVSELAEIIIEFGNKGSWAQGALNNYVEKYWDSLMANHQLISLDEYYDLTSDISPELMKELIDYWGDGLGEIMVYNNEYLVIPGVQYGNVFITFQPSRGWEEVDNYHDATLPPHQQYVAFYKWLDKTKDTNAIIYMGTHGTLEFLPGHSIGVQEGDWVFELTNTPSIYPYIVSNPGEAMVAKDRLGALMITHMTPAIVSSELYGNYSELSNAIDHYNEAVKLNVTANAESYKEMILELSSSVGFSTPSEGQSFDEWLDDLHTYLDELANDFNALGLHTLGLVLSGENLIQEVITIVSSQTTIYNEIMAKLFPYMAGLDFYDDVQGNAIYAIEMATIKEWLYSFVSELVNGSSCDQLAAKYGIEINSTLYNQTLYCVQVILNIYANNEWDALFSALNGSYVQAGLFSDPAYGASIPTGYNGYATDSTKVPSKASFESAKKIVNLLLVEYYEKHGEWPELVGLVLWGTEILRTEGIGISEFLYLLGCEPIWSYTGVVTGVKLLPLEDLTVTLSDGTTVNRPRIDVYASMVTSNTDWITWMVTATKLAADADESPSNNFVIKHYQENPSLDRLFGLPGNVLEGTGMSTLIPNTNDWNIGNISDTLADIYMDRVSYSWTLDEDGNLVITQQKDNYAYLLGKTDLITQNLDSTWRVLDSDDYYDWFGGLLNAAKHYGANPDTAFVDIRNKNDYSTNTALEQIEFELRSYVTNPLFMDESAKSDAGMLAWSSKIQNFYGFLVVGGYDLSTGLGNQLSNAVLEMSGHVSSTAGSAAVQSAAAWMIYMYTQGKWQTDLATVQQLANMIIEQATSYDVACCHHTCANINFNEQLLQLSTASSELKQAYADKFQSTTLVDISDMIPQDPVDPSEPTEPTNPENPNVPSNSTEQDDIQDDILVNGTTSESIQGGGGVTSAGMEASSENPNAESSGSQASSQSAASSPSAGSQASSQNNAYELSQKSANKVASSSSSMPVYFIIAVIVIICIFIAGYSRHKNNEDEY